jgi:putative heme-binding domain-containing protein
MMSPFLGGKEWFWLGALLGATILIFGRDGFGQEAATGDDEVAWEALSRLKGVDLEAHPAVKAAVFKLLEQSRGTARYVEIVREFNIKGRDAELVQMAVDHPSTSMGVEAIRLAGKDSEVVKAALKGTNSSKVIEVLGNSGVQDVGGLLEPIIFEPGRTALEREKAVRALCQTREGAMKVLELTRKKQLTDELKGIAQIEMGKAHWPEVKAAAARIFPGDKSSNVEGLPAISELVKRSGDPAKGAQVFRRDNVGCINCHQVNGDGVEVGPNLSEIGAKLAKEAIYEAILDPSAGISFGFEAWQLDLVNGDEAYGIITSETAEEIAMRSLPGIVTRYKKKDVARRAQQKVSMMPSGLQQAMSTGELVDLVEYLLSLKKARSDTKR